MRNMEQNKSDGNEIWWAIVGLAVWAVLMLFFGGQIAVVAICSAGSVGLAFDAIRKQEKELILMAAAAAAAAALFGTGSGIISAVVGVVIYVLVWVVSGIVSAMCDLTANSRQE